MTTITGAVTQPQRGVVVHTWTGFAASADVGTALDTAYLNDKTVQVSGTFTGSLAITIQGSNDGTNWNTLADPQGTALVISAAGIEVILENPLMIRALATAGSGSADVDVVIVSRGGVA